jgi:putative intracellular protease/amidase
MTNADVPRLIGILLFDGMEELDALGPWEVFGWWTQHFPEDDDAATTFSADDQPVTCEKSLVVQPHRGLAGLPRLDVLLHPGGDGTQRMLDDPIHLTWLREQRMRVPLITSVFTGSTILAAAGLLRDRLATSNRDALDELRRIDPSITVQRAGATSTTARSSPPPASPPVDGMPGSSVRGATHTVRPPGYVRSTEMLDRSTWPRRGRERHIRRSPNMLGAPRSVQPQDIQDRCGAALTGVAAG